MLKLQRSDIIVCTAIILLGVVAAVLGLIAETKRIKASQVISSNGHCIYPSNSALLLGVIAAFSLLLGQVIANVAGGCICCIRGANGPYPSSSSKTIAILSLILSWVTFLNAFVLLLAGASLQNRHQQDDQWFGGRCFVVKPGVFVTGALLSLATAGFGLVYFLAVSKVQRTARWNEQPPTIAMGQAYGPPFGPMFLPQNYQYQGQQPVHSQYPLGGMYPAYPPNNPYSAYPVQYQTPAGPAYDRPKQ
ncbi:hypothetical protein O6H91_20G068700 [Diphasiastrum complanatum]|uniref:Uncharacterized protein n=1 Tax=Diphasiastrum complanatum TaxID=34168 RepID=A0ACC2ARI2_DIPCM|nr:hypothetical protein O6H91_20G068700 [Diphasiastrum complanatum]